MNLKELILQESFHQNFPLKVDDFIKYCENRGLTVNRAHLEYLEKENIFKPIFRINGWYVSNTTELKELYEQGHVDNPSQTDFVPWIDFLTHKDGYTEEIIHTYYHPFQIYFLKWILTDRLKLTSFDFPQNDDELLIRAKEWMEFLKTMDNVYNPQYQDKIVELLLYIQNKYFPVVKQSGLILNEYYSLTDNMFEKLDELKRNIIPEKIIKSLGLTVDEVINFRNSVGIRGLSVDPLEKWYDLIKYINYKKRQKLKDNALLAQDFYLISDMLALFLEDLTGEKQL